MKICLFYHSIIADWNHGSAHFLRGIVTSLLNNGHQVIVYEPMNGWSIGNSISEEGHDLLNEFSKRFPAHQVRFFNEEKFIPFMLNEVNLVIVHEWNKPELIKKIGTHKKFYGNYVLLFHDTNQRSKSTLSNINLFDLSGYDGVLAFGDILTQYYLQQNLTKNAWTWHEAADTNMFKPFENSDQPGGDLVWIGNWKNDDRIEAIEEFILEPVRSLKLKTIFYGNHYPESALKLLKESDIEYGGWLPNYKIPEIYSNYKFTIHIPHRSNNERLPGIPTIRFFEAMACGIPLISAPWIDSSNLFHTNSDYIMVQNGTEMKKVICNVLENKQLRADLIKNGIETITNHHSCDLRVTELFRIYSQLKEINQEKHA